MDMIDRPNGEIEVRDTVGLNRRAVLMTAAVAASAAAGVSSALADAASPGNFGAPLVELYVPPGVLTLEQKAAMIKGMTDVVFNTMKLSPNSPGKSFVQIIETGEGGFGVNGQVFVPRGK